MNDVTMRNRRLGPETVMQLVEERAPAGFARIEDVVSRAELDASTKPFAQAAGLDVATVNERSSFVQVPVDRGVTAR